MATPSPQGLSRYSAGNDRRKTFQVVRLDKRRTHASSLLTQDSGQHAGAMTKTQRVASVAPANHPSAQSMKCAICTALNPPSAKFCNECGSPLSLRMCPQCEAIYARTASKCVACGFVTAAEDAAATPSAVAAAATPPSPAPVGDTHHPIETTEHWKALLQEVEEQLHRQVEEQVHQHLHVSTPVVEQDPKGLFKNVASTAKTARERPRERNVRGIHEHLEALRNAVLASAIAFQQTLKRSLWGLASWSAVVAGLRWHVDLPTLLVEQDAKWFLWRLANWSAVVAGTGVLVYLLFAPPRPLLALDSTATRVTANSIVPAGEATAGVRPYTEGKIIRETAADAQAGPAVTLPPRDKAKEVSAAPPASDSVPTTPSRGPTAEPVPSQVKPRPTVVAKRDAPKAALNARPAQAVPPKKAPARVASAKPLMVKTGHGGGMSANGKRPAGAPLMKSEPPRAPTSQPCSATPDLPTSCGAKTVAVVEAKTNALQTVTASPEALQLENAAKIPPASADLVASSPAPGNDTLPGIQPAPVSAPETTASATVNDPAQPAPAVVAMAAPTSADAAPKPNAASPVAKIVHREDPVFPREAIVDGITSGKVKVRLAIAGNGTVSNVTITESQPRRVFDQAVIRALKHWQFESTGAPQTVETEVAFSAGN